MKTINQKRPQCAEITLPIRKFGKKIEMLVPECSLEAYL